MKRKKIKFVAALGLALTLALSACAGPNSGTDSAKKAEKESGTGAAETEAKLFIGLPPKYKEVAAPASDDPGELLKALSEETGWKLSLAKPIERTEDRGLHVAFAKDSILYGALPEEQKKAYRFNDTEDMLYTVLSSVSETLGWNLSAPVYFEAPDGKPLSIDNNGVKLSLLPDFSWYYPAAYDSNHLNPDTLNLAGKTPNDEDGARMGTAQMDLIFAESDVKPASGEIRVYDETAGKLFAEIDVTDSSVKLHSEKEVASTLLAYNLSQGTWLSVGMPTYFEGGHRYSVEIDNGAFTSGNINSPKIKRENWQFEVSDYGTIMGDDMPLGDDPLIIGKEYHVSVIMGSMDYMQMQYDPEYFTVSTEKLTKDGTVTLTPKKASDEQEVDFTFVDQDRKLTFPLAMYTAIE